MKAIFLMLALPLQAQFITPEFRGSSQSEYAEWDQFTEAKFIDNSPDVAPDNATILCFTSSAFLTSTGNIYSFQSPTSFQLDDSAAFPISNVFLQISGLGSGIDLENVRIVVDTPAGETLVVFPDQKFIISQEELGGENGGIGSTYALQWDFSEMPILGSYAILFNSIESSFSLDKVALDTSADFLSVSKPLPLTMTHTEDTVTLAWLGTQTLQTSTNLSGSWTNVPTPAGANSITLPIAENSTFFRLAPAQTSATE